jgi:hypothetical protein
MIVLACLSLAVTSVWVGLIRPALEKAAYAGSDMAGRIVGY